MGKKTTLIVALFISINCFAQTKEDSSLQFSSHFDTVLQKTSMKDFVKFVEDNVTITQYRDVKYIDLYNAFVQRQYQLWIATKSKPKK